MLKDTIKQDMIVFMKAHDQVAVDTIRTLNAAIRNYEIDKSHSYSASDEEVLQITQKEVKKRKEAIELYKKGNRQDLVDQESREADILSKYLPVQISDDALKAIVESAIKKTNASSPQDIGAVMKAVMPEVKGQADGSAVKDMVLSLLS